MSCNRNQGKIIIIVENIDTKMVNTKSWLTQNMIQVLNAFSIIKLQSNLNILHEKYG